MDKLTIQYRVLATDFREASYYALFLRKKTGFRLAAAVLLSFFVYAVLCVNGVFEMEPLAAFVAAAYLIWCLLQLASAERAILRYTKAPDSLIGAEYIAVFGHRHFSISLPVRDFHLSGEISDLTFAFELTHCFLLYVTDQQMFIIPTRNMTTAEAETLRHLLSTTLTSRFHSLFLRRKR